MADLRETIEGLAAAIEAAMASRGLPVIEADDENLWELVGPASRALSRARNALDTKARSARALQAACQELLSTAAALSDPAQRARPVGADNPLAIVVPGPDGPTPEGLVDCAMEHGARVVRWYPNGWSGEVTPLAVAAGRPDSYRYRWKNKTVWEDLAIDLIAVCCGWRADPRSLPPALRRSAVMFARRLRSDLATGEWTLTANDVTSWLIRARAAVTLEPAAKPSQ